MSDPASKASERIEALVGSDPRLRAEVADAIREEYAAVRPFVDAGCALAVKASGAPGVREDDVVFVTYPWLAFRYNLKAKDFVALAKLGGVQ